MPEREIVEAARGNLLGRDHDVVGVGLAGDRDRAVDHSHAIGRLGDDRGVEALEWALRCLLGREHGPEDDHVARGQVDPRATRGKDRDEVVVRIAAGKRLEVIGAVDRRAVVHVVRARDDDRADLRRGKPGEFGRDAIGGAAWLRVRVEQVAGDQEQVHPLLDREIDSGLEGRELALALGRRLIAHVGVAGSEMDVGCMDDAEHRRCLCLLTSTGRRRGWRANSLGTSLAPDGPGASEAPP